MSNVKFNALASLALLAGAPVVAQAEMVEMTETQMANVSGQGVFSAIAFNSFFPIVPTDVLPSFIDGDGFAVGFNTNFLPLAAANATNAQLVNNAGEFGTGVADTVFYGPFSALDLASRILAAPLNAVFGPVNRYLDGVTGRAQATVDGAAYAFTEVKGALITNAFASAANAAGNNGLVFTNRVFTRIAQAQAGLTTQRLEGLAGNYGY